MIAAQSGFGRSGLDNRASECDLGFGNKIGVDVVARSHKQIANFAICPKVMRRDVQVVDDVARLEDDQARSQQAKKPLFSTED